MNRMIAQLISNMCVANEKDMALRRKIWSRFVTVLWCSKTEITDRTGILVLERVLWDMIFKIYWQFWRSFFKKCTRKQLQFNPIEITWRKMVRSVCVTAVSMATWRLHTLWHFTKSLYQRIRVFWCCYFYMFTPFYNTENCIRNIYIFMYIIFVTHIAVHWINALHTPWIMWLQLLPTNELCFIKLIKYNLFSVLNSISLLL